MALTPLNGFAKKVADLPDKPNASMTSAEVKAQFDAAVEELRVFLNSKLAQIDTDFSLKSEIASALLGQILDNSLTDAKLSNAVGQVKDRLSKVITDLANFIATKSIANGIAPLGSDGKVPFSQLSSVMASGMYTGDGAASKFINLGFTPSAVLVIKDGLMFDASGISRYGGLAVTANNANFSGLNVVAVTTNGFNVAYDAGNYIFTNNSNGKYNYIAFK